MKQPKANEWWVANSGSGLIAYIVGSTLNGDPAWQQHGSRQIFSDEIVFFLSCFHHEPRCTGFDWVEPQDPYPHYYTSLAPSMAYTRRDSDTTSTIVRKDGGKCPDSWYPNSHKGRTRLTEAEALARVTPVVRLSNCPKCGEFQGHGHQCKPKRVPVRLWCVDDQSQDGFGSNVIVSPVSPVVMCGETFQEILHDGEGFYVEVTE